MEDLGHDQPLRKMVADLAIVVVLDERGNLRADLPDRMSVDREEPGAGGCGMLTIDLLDERAVCEVIEADRELMERRSGNVRIRGGGVSLEEVHLRIEREGQPSVTVSDGRDQSRQLHHGFVLMQPRETLPDPFDVPMELLGGHCMEQVGMDPRHLGLERIEIRLPTRHPVRVDRNRLDRRVRRGRRARQHHA
ncbi:MAG: hypothetical protein R3E12_05335 [Candidatus Eisenbacteria bacterium]